MPVPSLSAANTATPKSIPTGGRVGSAGSGISRSHWTAANQCPARRDTVMVQMAPGSAVQPRSRTHPNFGSFTRPDDTPVRLTNSETGSGQRKLSFSPFRRGIGALARPAHQF